MSALAAIAQVAKGHLFFGRLSLSQQGALIEDSAL